MSKRFSWEPRTEVGDQHNQLTVIDNTVDYRGTRMRHIMVACSCGNKFPIREYVFVKRQGGGMCRACAMVAAGAQRRLPDNDSARNDYRNDYLQGARARGYEFSLSKEQFDLLIGQDCYYCGAPPAKRAVCRSSVVLVNGVDRYDNSHGYTPENSVSCCKTCNFAKHTMHGGEFIAWVHRIAERHPS